LSTPARFSRTSLRRTLTTMKLARYLSALIGSHGRFLNLLYTGIDEVLEDVATLRNYGHADRKSRQSQ
jgi:hypothetical protein